MAKKDYSRQITVAEMAPHVHVFKIGENKVNKIVSWLSAWITSSLESQKIKPYDFLPSKGSLAFHIGVSKGTMQNVFRTLEDFGLVESKQKIGTYIKDTKSQKTEEKLTSKRDVISEKLKKYIYDSHFLIGENIGSTRELAQILHTSNTTLRLSINRLVSEGILSKKNNKFIVVKTELKYNNIEAKTLTEKICLKLKKYIKTELKEKKKLPSNIELAKIYNVSIKTIHDAIKQLSKEGIVITRRGRYGSSVAESITNEPYFYEKVENKIKEYIIKNCEIGSKLPSIREFAQIYNVSTKTIKKALDNLSDDGYLRFNRGRYGGTFVIELPSVGENYTWLAISQEYISNNDN